MQNDHRERIRGSHFMDRFTSHPPDRHLSDLFFQVGLMLLVFLMVAGALVLVGWVMI